MTHGAPSFSQSWADGTAPSAEPWLMAGNAP